MNFPAWRGVVADLERTGTPKGRDALGYFSIEGVRLHERALRAGVGVERAVVTETLRRGADERVQRLLAELESRGGRLYTVPDEALRSLTGGRKTGGLMGLVRLPDPADLELVASSNERTVLLVAVDVEDPGNVGALTRTALAGFASAFVAVGISDPHHPRALRTSMGSVFKLPVAARPALMPLLAELRALGFATIGAVSSKGTPLASADVARRRVAILMGSEAFGLGPAIVESLDQRVTIPMAGGVDSFSVNAAAAILLYEVHRRSGTGS